MNTILFVLPVSGGSGGAHSVMQESEAMLMLGINVRIAVNKDNSESLRKTYRDLPLLTSHVYDYNGADGLAELIKRINPDVTVATTNQSVHVLAEAIKLQGLNGVRTAYYIQDYEPLFYDKSSSDWFTAYASYGLIPGMIHFAKTQWLQQIVEANHGVKVAKVAPSIDHKIYSPLLNLRNTTKGRLKVVAMIRPSTPRRAPRRTVRMMNRLAHEFGDQVSCVTFGCQPEELASLRLANVRHLGVLARKEVGELFQDCDLFLDLSDFQAFGRTAIEAMSCGAVAVVPAHGGVYEFAVDGYNAFVVDTRDENAIFNAVKQFMAMSVADRQNMMLAAIEAGFCFNQEIAAISEIKLLLTTAVE